MPLRQNTVDDLKKLDVLGMTPGDVFSWEALEEILAPLTRHDRRFRTIYRAWIRHVRKWHNRKMIVEPGKGLRILHEHERAGDVCGTLGKTWGLFERAKTDIDDVQIVELDAAQLETTHHVRHVTHRLHRAMQQQRAALAVGAPASEPSPSPPLRMMA